MMELCLACGEVQWERALLEALRDADETIEIHRFVDLDSLVAHVRRSSSTVFVVMSPALRGFAAKPIEALAGSGTRIVIIRDSVRPPWLDSSALDIRERDGLHFAAFAPELVQLARTETSAGDQESEGGCITVFVGSSGGVGVTTLAWLYAQSRAGSLLVDGNTAQPLCGFLAGADASSATLMSALATLLHQPDARIGDAPPARVLTLPVDGEGGLAARDADILLSAAAAQYAEVVIDAGVVGGSPFASACLERADRVVLVTTAEPRGVLRLPTAMRVVRREGLDVTVIVNRLRDSAVGSRHARSALRSLTERTCDATPRFVDDDPQQFDAAWIDGDWRKLQAAVGNLVA